MTQPPVSIVVTVFNGERFLAEALDSAFAQDHPRFEVVVVDDGSTDSTPEVISRYPRARVLRQPNSGEAAARNTGIEAAEGDVIAFLDADDVLPPDKLAIQVEVLERSPSAGLVLGRQELRFEDGITQPSWSERPFWLPLDLDWEGREQIPPMSMLARAEVFDRVGAFDPRFPTCTDLDWMLRAMEAEVGIEIVDDIVLIRRLHRGNLTADTEAVERNTFAVLRSRMERARARARAAR